MAKQTILITGATSGLGAELARQYANPQSMLILTGRNSERLEQIKIEIKAKGATVIAKTIDVTDRDAMACWLKALAADTLPDLIYANAGIADGVCGRAYEPESVSRAQFKTNFFGVLNTIYPLLPFFEARGYGQIVIISSLAGYGPLAATPGYSGSKAAVRVWGESMRFALGRLGIDLTMVCPGFIETPMTRNNPFPMPFLVDLPRATQIIRHGVTTRRRRLAFPWPLAFLTWLLHALHPAWSEPLLKRTLPPLKPSEQPE